MTMFTAIPLLMSLHRRLFIRLWLFDLGFLAAAVAYLLLPVAWDRIDTENAIFLVLLILACAVHHVRIIDEGRGGAAYYLTLPMRVYRLLLPAFAAALAPFSIALAVVTFALCGLHAVNTPVPPPAELWLKAFHAFTVFYLIKIVALPSCILSKRHPLWIFLFYASFIPTGLVASIIHEIFFANSSYAGILLALTFLVLSSLVCWMVTLKARI